MNRSARPILFLAVFSISALFLLTIFREPLQPHLKNAPQTNCSAELVHLQKISCLIDGITRIPCVKQTDTNGRSEVFLPFNGFISSQFDVYGQFMNQNDRVFEYFTSAIKIQQQLDNRGLKEAQNSPLDTFNNVALRSRVKCLKPENGLPMSVQWDPSKTMPYFYPIQILQFGMEHLAKYKAINKDQGPIVRKVAKKMLNTKKGRDGDKINVLKLENGQSAEFKLFSWQSLPILMFKWKATGQAGFELIFDGKTEEEMKKTLRIEFRPSEGRRDCVWLAEGNGQEGREWHFVYGLEQASRDVGENANFTEFLLDMPIFMEKAFALLANPGNNSRTHQRQQQFAINDYDQQRKLRFFGPSELLLDTLQQQNHALKEIFLRVAYWLVENQDAKGGWTVPVRRTFDIDGGHKLVLQPGWPSAMAQGHALSFLARVYAATGDPIFLEAGQRALALFELPAPDGGVLNRMFGFDWFEEYPTHPDGTFVLNGFMYALIGLNDFSPHSNYSRLLFRHGIGSLRALLPLFDTGQRSIYDLRHLRLASRPNLARWDYHALHITLLDWLHSITDEPMLAQVAQRWTEYARGSPLKHN